MVNQYVAEMNPTGRWTEKTAEDYRSAFDLFIEIIGDVPVKSIGFDTIREYKNTLLRLPPYSRQYPKYKEKSFKEILEMDFEKTLSVTTVNKKLKRISSLFNFAVKNGLMLTNPVPGMMIPNIKRDEEYRAVCTPEDLNRIFHSEQYPKDDHSWSYQFWVLPIALYAGCRLEEICQLHLEDIRQEQEIWVFGINNNGEKRLKNQSSARLVPIHPFLLDDLKITEYAASLRARGETRLFPELTQYRDGYHPRASAWYKYYKKRCGIVDDGEKKKDLHSFRHTFVNTLKQRREVDTYLISELVGHTLTSITQSRYGKRYNPQIVYCAIITLDYDVYLGHLTLSRYVI